MQEVKSRIPVLKPIRSAKQKQIDKLKDDTIDSSTSHKPTRSTDDLRNSTVNNTLKSNCSITPSDFDSLCNANYISEDGLESLKSDVSNVTNSGLNTLYHLEYYKSFGFHQKNGGVLRTTSSSSQLAEISSLSGDESIMSDDLVEHWDSLKEAFSGFEDCLRELAPESLESGLGLSPNFNADPCLLNKPIMEQYEHKMPSPPSDPKPSRSPTNQPKAAKRMEKLGINLDYDLRWSQASSGDDFENEGTSKSVVYENPNNRVEHQLYSLEGNCRSSFEMVYSPPVTAEQVVTQVKSASPVQNELVIQDFSLSAYEPISPQLRNLKGKYTSGSATPNSYEIRSVRSDESEDEDVHSSISSDYESPTKPNKTPTFGPRIPLPVHKSNSNGSENQPSTSLTTSISTIISSPTSNFASEPANSISKRLSLNVPQSPSDHSSLTAVPEKCVASPTNVPYYCQPPSNIQSDCRQAPSYTINANSLPTLTASLGKEIGGSNCDAFNNANSPVPALPIRTGSTVVIKTGCIAPSPTPRKPHSGGIYRRQNIEPSRNSVTNLTNSARSPIVSRNPMSVASQRYESRIQEQKGINYMSADEKSYDYEDDEDKEWNKKLEHIAKWQRDVHSALQDSQQNAFAPPVRLPVKCASFVKPSKDEEWSVDEWPVIKKVYAKGALGELEQLYDRINIEKQLENSPPTVQPVPRRSRISQKISTHSSPQLVQSTGGDNLPNEADKNEMQKPILDIEKKRQSFNQPTMISRPTQNKSISPFELPQRDDVANRGYGSNIRTTSFDPRTDHTDDSSTPYRIHNTPTVLSINPTSNHLQNRLQQSQSLNRGWNQPHEMRQNPPVQQHIPWRSNPVQFISNKSSKVHLGQPRSQPIPGAQPVINRMPRESANRVHSQSPISVAFSPGYAEALSLATAATDAVKEAVDRKSVHDEKRYWWPYAHGHLGSQYKSQAKMGLIEPKTNGYLQIPINPCFNKPIESKFDRLQEACAAISNTRPSALINDTKNRIYTSFYSGTGRIAVPARTKVPQKVISNPTWNDQGKPSDISRLVLNIQPSSGNSIRYSPGLRVSGSMDGNMNLAGHRLAAKSVTPASSSNRFRNTQEPRSQSLGPSGLPPPADVNSYPLISDLARGLKNVRGTPYFTSDDRYIEAPAVQSLRPKKFLLGRVISNEDICIQTETPFAFSIASTGKNICIAKVASADDLNARPVMRKAINKRTGKQAPLITNCFSADLIDDENDDEDGNGNIMDGIPVSLRLTFGSTPCVNTMTKSPSIMTTYRSVLHIDMSGGGKGNQYNPPRMNGIQTPFRASLPCMMTTATSSRNNRTKPPIRGQQNVTFFEQDI